MGLVSLLMQQIHRITQSVEGKWGDVKNTLRGMRGTRGEYQELILFGRMWRHNLRQKGKSAFEELVSLLGRADTLFANAEVVDEDQ